MDERTEHDKAIQAAGPDTPSESVWARTINDAMAAPLAVRATLLKTAIAIRALRPVGATLAHRHRAASIDPVFMAHR